MKALLMSALLAVSTLSTAGCVVYPAHSRVVYTYSPGNVYPDSDTVVYEGQTYYYDYSPAYVAGAAVIGLYVLDGYGHRHYRYVPYHNWHGSYPRYFRHHH